jgi:sugar lactone lactonase YvrE
MTTISRIGDLSMQWGESVRWDDERQRLYFVDCATHQLYWMDDLEAPPRSFKLPTMPAGIVPCTDGRLVIALDDGLNVVDPDDERVELLAPYPKEMNGRANDAAADLSGNLVTGTLNLMEGPGSYWWFSARDGWQQLDDGISNTNGPVVLDNDGEHTLVIADTPANRLYAYDYDGTAGAVTGRRVFADTGELDGSPDGACADDGGGVWSCVLGPGRIVRYTTDGVTDQLDATVELPSDVTFGGPNLDRMFFVSIAVAIGDIEIRSPNAGALMVADDTGYRGRTEPRFRL